MPFASQSAHEDNNRTTLEFKFLRYGHADRNDHE